jgi:hypothetical protein
MSSDGPRRKASGSHEKPLRGAPREDKLAAMAQSLKDIVRIAHKDPWQARHRFLTALNDWAWDAPDRKNTPFEEWPEMPRMIWTLWAIHGEVFGSGLLYLIDRETGNHVAFGKKWLSKIGAKRSVAYLNALAKLFPGKKIPTTVEGRAAALAEVFPGDEDMFQLDAALTPIDDKYRDAVLEEIPDRLREYVRDNVAAIEKNAKLRTRKGKPDDVILTEPDQVHPFAWMYSLLERPDFKAGIEAQGPQPAIGEVIEVFARKHYVYLQVTHGHFYEAVEGMVVRVLPGAHKKPVSPEQLEALVAGPELYFGLFNLPFQRQSIARWPDPKEVIRFRELGKHAVPPSATAFPVFMYHVGKTRDGRNVWDIWKGGRLPDSRAISPLRDDMKNLPDPTPFAPDFLVRDVLDGSQPIDEHKRRWGEL